MIKVCQQCNQPFTGNPKTGYRQKYCSRTCFSQSRNTRITKTCEQCGKSFEVIQSFKDRRFCSTVCAGLSKVTRTERVCRTCGKSFEVIQARKDAVFCSFECQMIEQKKKVKLSCKVCRMTFYEKPSQAHYRQTCSRSCQAKLRAQEGTHPMQGRKRTDAEKQKFSESTRRYFQENPQKHPWYVDGSYANGQLRRGPSWQQQRKAARARDNYTCRRCGITEEQLGKQLSVHHKILYRLFASSDEANRLENLICLCQSCHWKVEHHPELLEEIA